MNAGNGGVRKVSCASCICSFKIKYHYTVSYTETFEAAQSLQLRFRIKQQERGGAKWNQWETSKVQTTGDPKEQKDPTHVQAKKSY